MTLLGDENEKELPIEIGNRCRENNPISTFEPKDEIELGESSKISNLTKVAMILKTISFAENTTFHGVRYIFMKNISVPKR